MLLLPDSVGSISQVTFLQSLCTLVVSTKFSNHFYVDLKPILTMGITDQTLVLQMIAVKSPTNTPSISGSCMAGRQLICGKEDSNVWQVNPPSTKISQTSAFKSRKTTIKFGLLFQLEDFESSLISLHFALGTLHIVLLDLANHRVVQYMDIEGVRLFAFAKNVLEVLLEDNKIERYKILSLEQRYKCVVE